MSACILDFACLHFLHLAIQSPRPFQSNAAIGSTLPQVQHVFSIIFLFSDGYGRTRLYAIACRLYPIIRATSTLILSHGYDVRNFACFAGCGPRVWHRAWDCVVVAWHSNHLLIITSVLIPQPLSRRRDVATRLTQPVFALTAHLCLLVRRYLLSEIHFHYTTFL